MNLIPTNAVTMFQLADSSLPVGSYAFSNGLEAANHYGLFSSNKDLTKYLHCFVQQVCDSEMPYIVSVFEDISPEQPDNQLSDMIQDLDAMLTIPTMKMASIVQGKNYMRVFTTLYPESDIAWIQSWFNDNKAQTHYLIVYAMCLKSIGISLDDAVTLHYYSSIRDQISAAVRLGIVGPLEAGRIQKHILDTSDRYKDTIPRNYTEAVKHGPMIEMMQGRHKDLYTKLFQN